MWINTVKSQFVTQKEQPLRLNLEHFCVLIMRDYLGGHIYINICQTSDICRLNCYVMDQLLSQSFTRPRGGGEEGVFH
jgi:hypothetical protein